MEYIGVIAHLLTFDPNFQRDILVDLVYEYLAWEISTDHTFSKVVYHLKCSRRLYTKVSPVAPLKYTANLGICVKFQVAAWLSLPLFVFLHSGLSLGVMTRRFFLSSCYDNSKATWPRAGLFSHNHRTSFGKRVLLQMAFFCQWDQPVHEVIISNRPTTMAITKTSAILPPTQKFYWFKAKHPCEKNKDFGWLWRPNVFIHSWNLPVGNQPLP